MSKHFYYFGDQRVDIPEKFVKVIWDRQGIHYTRDHQLADGFVKWLEANHQPGVLGKPQPMKEPKPAR